MKTKQFLVAALAATTLVSCSQVTSVVDSSNEPGKEAKLSINFENATKVASDALDSEDLKMNDFMAFVFRDNGALDVSPIYIPSVTTPAGPSAQELTVTTKAHEVYIIANVGDQTVNNGLFEGVTKKTDLEGLSLDRISDLGVNTQGNANIKTKNVLMTGVSNVVEFDAAYKAAVNITVAFPLAKIRVIVVDERKNNMTTTNLAAVGDISITDQNVVLMYAGRKVKLFTADAGVDRQTQTTFYTGDSDISFPYVEVDAVNFADAVTTPFPTTGTAINNHFYTAANDGMFETNTTSTILAIQSSMVIREASTNGQAVKIFYPMKFNTADARQIIKSGESYTVTLTLRGDVQAGGGQGVVDPEDDLITGALTATISITEWKPITLGKEFD